MNNGYRHGLVDQSKIGVYEVYDNLRTNCREVHTAGILALKTPSVLLHISVFDGRGKPVQLQPWGSFPDSPENVAG